MLEQILKNTLYLLDVSSAQQSPNILVKSIPLQLREEWESELVRNLGQLLYLRHSQLFLNSKAVKEVSTEHETVFRSVDCVDPATGYQQSISCLQHDLATLGNSVSEEYISLLPTESPVLVQLEIVISGWNQPEHLLTSDNVIPDRGASEVNVEVSVAACHRHQTILLHLQT